MENTFPYSFFRVVITTKYYPTPPQPTPTGENLNVIRLYAVLPNACRNKWKSFYTHYHKHTHTQMDM